MGLSEVATDACVEECECDDSSCTSRLYRPSSTLAPSDVSAGCCGGGTEGGLRLCNEAQNEVIEASI